MTASRRIVSTPASEAHAGEVAAFYREVWEPDATPESVIAGMRQAAASNVASPGELPPIALVLEGTRVVGYCGSIPQLLWDGVQERPAYWVKGLMVLPEYRNGPIGYMAVKELVGRLQCSTILTVAPGARRLFAALGYTDLGAVPNWVKPLRPGVMARELDLAALGLEKLPSWAAGGIRAAQRLGVATLAGGAVGILANVAAAGARIPAARLDTEERAVPRREELDDLWREARTHIASSPVRDATYLVPRFTGNRDDDPYSFVVARDGGRIVGAAVVRRPKATSDPRLGKVRVATISDILFPANRIDAGLATLGAVERTARAAHADALTCMACHPALIRPLRRQGYLRLGGNVHFFLRDVTGLSQWPTDLTSWWLGRGDGESDATF